MFLIFFLTYLLLMVAARNPLRLQNLSHLTTILVKCLIFDEAAFFYILLNYFMLLF